MFTNENYYKSDMDRALADSFCLSTDTKPTAGIANGSLLLEMDTSKIYAFDEQNQTWLEIQ